MKLGRTRIQCSAVYNRDPRIKIGRRTPLVVKLRKFETVDMLTGNVTRNFRHFR